MRRLQPLWWLGLLGLAAPGLASAAALSISTVASNVSCYGGSNGVIQAMGQGGSPPYSFSWSPPTTSAYGGTAAGLPAGSYTVTVSDGAGASVSKQVSLTEPAELVVRSTVTHVSVYGGRNGVIQATASGGASGYTYFWQPGNATHSAITGLAAGTYTVTVTDANGCVKTASATVSQPDSALAASATVTAVVSTPGGHDGAASVSASGGWAPYSYAWSPVGGSAAQASGLAAGTYTVTVTDAASSTATAEVTVGYDISPDAFSFATQSGVPRSTPVVSEAITVTGIAAPAPIRVSGGEYRINSNPWTTSPGTVAAGDQVSVRHSSAAGYETQTDTTLSIGDVSAVFSSLTVSAPVDGVCADPGPLAFAPPASPSLLCRVGLPLDIRSGSPWTWQCSGMFDGAAAQCSAPNQPLSGGGSARVELGGPWRVSLGASEGFIPATGHPKSPPSLPPGYRFPHGLLDFSLKGEGGADAQITIVYPAALAPGMVYWKYGPSPEGHGCSGADCAQPHWYALPPGQFSVTGSRVTLSITDGGLGDDDLSINGEIVDVGGPAWPLASPDTPGADTPPPGIPSLGAGGLALLALGLGALGGWRRRRA